MSAVNWIWSAPHQDYYYVTYDSYNQPVYNWSKQTQVATAETDTRRDSHSQQHYESNVAQMPEPAPQDVRVLPDFISGTPRTGWYDLLDSSYRMRTGAEAHEFFVVGRVFAMLYTETASETSYSHPNDDAYTVVRFNGRAHTNIRRFIVLEVRRGFVYACGIGTYSGRGSAKAGCNPSEHTIAYLSGANPRACYMTGEWANGMTKEPIEIIPVDSSIQLRPESRIRFSKRYPIEMNVKVKDIGRVHPNHLSLLWQYWNDEDHAQREESQQVEFQQEFQQQG